METARLTPERIARSVGELLEARESEVSIEAASRRPSSRLVVKAGDHLFHVEWRSSGDATHVAAALDGLRRDAPRVAKRAVPLVVVPFMGDVGKELCEKAGVAWLDLSGNAHITAPGIRVRVEGRPNRFKRRGRPASVFAPKSARIARWLLIHQGQSLSQRELARATGLDEGLTSRVVKRLEQEQLVARDDRGTVHAAQPAALLDAFREAYEFGKHQILRGHIAARSGEVLLRTTADAFKRLSVDHAATGLGAAWLWTQFAGFRLVTCYLREPPVPPLLQEIGFREDPRGANVWLVVPNDEGVFHGADERDEVRSVHPVQVYLDLKDQPERAPEAAAQLRSEHLTWRRDG
jgi:hypothetical protein